MPYPSFVMSIDCLDVKRIGKQRVEAKQIYDILTGKSNIKAWRNHPAVQMWAGYEDALSLYYNICLEFWAKKGYKNIKLQPIKINTDNIKMPPWMGNNRFHNSHKSNLLRKNPNHFLMLMINCLMFGQLKRDLYEKKRFG